jgi:hypothetical protein
LSTLELTSSNTQVLDGTDQNDSINTIIHKMDSTNETGSNETTSSGVRSSGAASSGVGSNEAGSNETGSNRTESSGVESNGTASSETGNGSATNSSSVPPTNGNTPGVASEEQRRDELLSLNYRNVAVADVYNTPVGADFSNNNYQNTPTEQLLDDHERLRNFRNEAMSNSDLLGDQQGRIENRNIQQDLVRAECS